MHRWPKLAVFWKKAATWCSPTPHNGSMEGGFRTEIFTARHHGTIIAMWRRSFTQTLALPRISLEVSIKHYASLVVKAPPAQPL